MIVKVTNPAPCCSKLLLLIELCHVVQVCHCRANAENPPFKTDISHTIKFTLSKCADWLLICSQSCAIITAIYARTFFSCQGTPHRLVVAPQFPLFSGPGNHSPSFLHGFAYSEHSMYMKTHSMWPFVSFT